jgi:hypothetical protein
MMIHIPLTEGQGFIDASRLMCISSSLVLVQFRVGDLPGFPFVTLFVQ